MVKRKRRRPLLDGTGLLLVLWILALVAGAVAGFVTVGEATGAENATETAQIARNFMVGATPFWIVSGIALVAGIALDDLTVQLNNRDDD